MTAGCCSASSRRLALGLAVGAVNAALVLLARIPAIIATLATGYILATASLLANRAIPGFHDRARRCA